MLLRKTSLLLLVIMLSACLPDEGDVSARYNAINQRAHIENTADSLATSAQNMTAYLMAAQMKRKTPLQNEGLIISDKPTDFTVQNNPKPASPIGVHVSACGKYGAIAYFTDIPAGVGSLKQHGSTMAASLARRFGNDAVGMKTINSVQLPKKGSILGCTVGGDIQDGSPIFATGFIAPKDSDGNTLEGLPDPMKTTQPTFKRDITLPCPNGADGVIKREQSCRLMFADTETTPENSKIMLGDQHNVENKVNRLQKRWDCVPAEGAALPPPSAEETAIYCRDPSNDLTKPNDNAIELKVSSLKKELETNVPGYYTYFCRANTDGSNTCDAVPFTPGPKTFLKCDKDLPPPRFVINPNHPLQLNPAGELLGDINEVRDCGRGWTGQMTARYLARRCQLMKTNAGGGTEVVSTAQTIYRIGYAQAQCQTDIRTTAACPSPDQVPGSDPNRRIPVTRHISMLKPVALDWSETKPGQAAWDTSKIATTDSRAEVRATATAPGKPQSVVPLITRAELDSYVDNNVWSEKLADAMYKADDKSIEIKKTSCDNSGDPCGVGGNSNGIEIWVDTAALQNGNYGGGRIVLPKLICSGTGSCNPILGQFQPMCNGTCDRAGGQDIELLESSYEQLLTAYLSKVDNPLPPDNAITRLNPSASLPLFNDPTVLCELASSQAKRLIIFGVFDESIDFDKPAGCPALGGDTYNSVRDMMDAAVDKYRSGGGDLYIFANHVTLGNEGKPVYHLLNVNDMTTGGLISTTIRDWLTNPVPKPNPCNNIN